MTSSPSVIPHSYLALTKRGALEQRKNRGLRDQRLALKKPQRRERHELKNRSIVECSVHKPSPSRLAALVRLVTNTNSPTIGNISAQDQQPIQNINTMVQDDDFSYANLRSMWSQRDKEAKPVKISPPTSRTPLRLAARSPERRRVDYSNGTNVGRNTQINKAHPVPKSRQMKRFELEMQSKVTLTNGAHLLDDTLRSSREENSDTASVEKDEGIIKSRDLSIETIETNSDEENIQPTQLWAHDDCIEKSSGDGCKDFEEVRSHDDSDGSSGDGRSFFEAAQYGIAHESCQETELAADHFQESIQDQAPEEDSFQDIRPNMEDDIAAAFSTPDSRDSFQDIEPNMQDEMAAAFSTFPSSDVWKVTQSRDPYDAFDPYDNFDSGSAVESEITVKMENTIMKAIQKKRENRKTSVLDEFEGGSNIPDSAFQNMAARLSSNITAAKYRPSKGLPREKAIIFQENSMIETPGLSSPMKTISELDIECSNDSSGFGSLFHNVPRGGANAHVAESDVFDGLSEMGSSIPAFGRNVFPVSEREDTEKSPSNGSKGITRSNSTSPIKHWPDIPFDEDWIPERSEEAKRKLSQNLATFAKTTKKDDNMGDGRMKLKIPSPRNRKEPVELDYSPSGRTSEDSGGSDSTDDGKFFPLDTSIGITRVNQNVTPTDSADIIKDLSKHFDLLTKSPKKTLLKAKMNVSGVKLMPNMKDDEDLFSQCDVKYANKHDEAADIVASVTWIPSMLRLYRRKSVTDSRNKGATRSHLQTSPNSVVDAKKENKITSSDCMLNGFESILLQYNQEYGGNIKDPALIISQMQAKVDTDVINKLRDGIDADNGTIRINSHRRKADIFDKAIEVHERALSLLDGKNLDEAIAVYEEFFECYSRREFAVNDEEQEKKIIAIFLFNMGMLYLSLNDCDLAIDFLKEGLSTLIDEDSASREIAVSYK